MGVNRITYQTIMAHLNLSHANDHVLEAAKFLADQTKARLIGIAACQPAQYSLGDGYSGIEIMSAVGDELHSELDDAENRFRTAIGSSGGPLEWRSRYTSTALASWIADEARSADLIITGMEQPDSLDFSRNVSIEDLVMRARRPVLLIPPEESGTPFDTIVLAWKDSREARRAAVDALPLLALAKTVIVLEITGTEDVSEAEDRVSDVAAWLGRHGIPAESRAIAARGTDAGRLEAILTELNADLVVAGAFGHSRLRQWVFGGVTHSLMQGVRSVLLSH